MIVELEYSGTHKNYVILHQSIQWTKVCKNILITDVMQLAFCY